MYTVRGLVTKETAVTVLRRWGVETNVWFINRVDKVIFVGLTLEMSALESFHGKGGQITFSTLSIIQTVEIKTIP